MFMPRQKREELKRKLTEIIEEVTDPEAENDMKAISDTIDQLHELFTGKKEADAARTQVMD